MGFSLAETSRGAKVPEGEGDVELGVSSSPQAAQSPVGEDLSGKMTCTDTDDEHQVLDAQLCRWPLLD